MTIKYGFFNSKDGDRKYNAEDIGRYLHGIVSSGVYADTSSSLQVLATDGMKVEVQPGRAMLDHHYMESDTPITFDLSFGTAPMIHAVVARVDMVNRQCGIYLKAGSATEGATIPTVTRTDTVKEYMLAYIHVNAWQQTISQSDITDTRADSSVCGWVTGVIDQVDTSTLFLQWQAAYEEALLEFDDYLEAQKASWESFFANVTEDNVLPAPALHDAGKAVIVNETTDGYEIKGFPTVNLLDNSNFMNPVNQRGAASYTAPADGYSIDRWKCPTSGTVRALDGYVEFVSTASTGFASFMQEIELSKIIPGKKYTFAAKVKGGGIYTAVFWLTETDFNSEYTDISANCGITVVATLHNHTPQSIRAQIRVYGTNSVALEWAALYEGEYTAYNLPAYQPKGYAAELLECKRYYQRISPGYIPFGFGWSNNTTPAAIRVSLPCSPMRIQPTVKFTGTANNVRLQFSQGACNIASVNGTHYDPDAEHIAIFMTPSTVYVGPFVAYCISDSEIFELSADL